MLLFAYIGNQLNSLNKNQLKQLPHRVCCFIDSHQLLTSCKFTPPPTHTLLSCKSGCWMSSYPGAPPLPGCMTSLMNVPQTRHFVPLLPKPIKTKQTDNSLT